MASNVVISKHEGRFPFVAGADISSGDGVAVGPLVGVALNDVANGATGYMTIEGVVTLAKPNNQAFTNGALLYWDDGNERVTTTEGTDTKPVAGYAYGAAAEAATTCSVLLARGPIGASA